MDIIQPTSFNESTSYFMSCHGSAILFKEAVWYAGCMVLELMLGRSMSCFPIALLFYLKKYGLIIAWLVWD
jgi:hypothetical protein